MKKLRFFLPLIVIMVLFVLTAQAQNVDEYEAKYKRGKELYEAGKYALAMEVLKPLTSAAEGNAYAEHAHYFYALSAFKGQQIKEARQILLQLTTRYPNWQKINEAYYLLSNISFENKNPRQALSYAEKAVGNKQLREDLDNMKNHYFRKLEPVDTLIQIQKDFPDDAIIAKVLAERLTGPFVSEKEMMLQQYLIQEFKLDASKFKKRRRPTEIKEVYNVAVLFPFMLGSLEPDKRNRPNQFVIDMYEGIRIAVDSLKNKDVSVKLFAYETERDSAKFAQLLAKPELKTMDLIIGPVFAHHHDMLGEFAYNHQINVVNPFGNSLSLVKNNEFMYLFQPALETQAHKMATLAGKSDSLRNRVIILYGESSKDSIIAHAYRDSLKHLNYTIHKFLKVNKNSVREIKTVLGDSLSLTKVNHIFVPSSDQVVAATVVSSMDVMRMDIPIVGYSEWINIQLMSYDQLERRKVHFLMPEFIDYTNPSVRNFKKAYIKKLDVFPSVYSYQGYELMYVFGMYLKKYGNVFNDDVRKCGQLNGITMGAFDYSCSNSNQVVPVIKFENSYLKPVSEFKRPEYISAEDLNPKKKK